MFPLTYCSTVVNCWLQPLHFRRRNVFPLCERVITTPLRVS
jgi:hypothetical protein